MLMGLKLSPSSTNKYITGTLREGKGRERKGREGGRGKGREGGRNRDRERERKGKGRKGMGRV